MNVNASKSVIVKSLNKNQLFRFVAYLLKLKGFIEVNPILRRTKIGIDFVAKREDKNFIIRLFNKKEKCDEQMLSSIIEILPLYKADEIVIISLVELDENVLNFAKKNGITLFGQIEIESILSEKFSNCTQFLDYMHNHEIRIYLKHTTKELIEEYYKLKNQLKKGYVSGNDINLHSKFSWMLYKNRFGTWKNFLEEIGEDTDRFKEITAEDLKDTYNQIKNKLGKHSITLQDMEDNSHYSEHPIKRIFGSWINFVNEMEGHHSNSSFNDDDIIEEYYRVKEKLGKEVITSTDMNKHAKFSSGVASWRFGSWTAFLNKIAEGQGKWERRDEQDLIDEYYRVKTQLKKERITWNDMLRHSKFPPNKYNYLFGNWGTFLKIVRGEITSQTYTEEELINEYLRVKRELQKDSLTVQDIILNGKYPPYLYKLKFGNLKQFYEKIGDVKTFYNEIKKQDLINDYNKVRQRLDKKKLTLKDYKVYGQYSQKLIRRHFGSWNTLIKENGIEVFKNHISDEELIKEYQRIKNEFKKEYISKEFMSKHSNIHVGTYIWRFGSWGKFLSMLGEDLDYLKAKKIEKLKESEIS